LAKAERATQARRCEDALWYYNQALRLQPGLRSKVAPRVRTCAAVLARAGEKHLQRAQKAYPMLAEYFSQEISRQKKAKAARKAKARKKAPADSAAGY
jgi:hypothetical protein